MPRLVKYAADHPTLPLRRSVAPAELDKVVLAGYARGLMLTAEQVEAYREQGYLRVFNIFTDEELRELSDDMDWIVGAWWGEESIGWKGPWRDHYLPEGEQEQTRAVFIGNPHFYSAA